MNFWMDNFMKDLKYALTEVDVLTINDEEAKAAFRRTVIGKSSKKSF